MNPLLPVTLSLVTLNFFTFVNALQCHVCCGCNGEASTACGTYGEAYNSYFSKSLNSKGAGKKMTCELVPEYAGSVNKTNEEVLQLSSIVPACSQVIYYDTTFNEDLTIKMCMSLDACLAQKELIGKSTHVYLAKGTAIFADVLSVQCCTDDLCNNLSAKIKPKPKKMETLPTDQPEPPTQAPVKIEEAPTTIGPMGMLIRKQEDSVATNEVKIGPILPRPVQPISSRKLTRPSHIFGDAAPAFADMVARSMISMAASMSRLPPVMTKYRNPRVIHADKTELSHLLRQPVEEAVVDRNDGRMRFLGLQPLRVIPRSKQAKTNGHHHYYASHDGVNVKKAKNPPHPHKFLKNLISGSTCLRHYPVSLYAFLVVVSVLSYVY